MSLWENHVPKTDEEIKQLATDLFAGHIFTDRHVSEPHMMQSVFMPLVFGGLSNESEEDLKQVGLVYEYLNLAGPRSINGYPCFMSLKFLHIDDTKRVFDKYNEIQKAMDQIS